MQVLTVIPIARGVFKDHLDYFSSKPIKPGAIVEVAVGKRLIKALVVKATPAAQVKSGLRQADFVLKKIGAIKNQQFFSPIFIKAIEDMSNYSGYPLGPVLTSLTPQVILDHCDELEAANYQPVIGPGLKGEKQLLQDTDDDRLSFYKSLIREEFARGASVFLCLPTAIDLEQVMSSLGRGIEEYTVALHHQLATKTLIANWQKAIASTHPLLIVGTPTFLCLPRLDVKTVIIDKESSPAYKSPARPFTDYRRLAEYLSERGNIRLIFGDLLLRVETLERAERDLVMASNPRQRLISEAVSKLYGVSGDVIIGEEAEEQLRHAANNNERTVILAGRRGLAPLIICDDCAEPVVCGRCQSPLVLHQAKKGSSIKEANWFLCHKCGERRSAEEKCHHCQGWRLRALGIGIERVAEELETRFPKVNIFIMDSDRIKTRKQAEELIKRFGETPGSFLLGTEMALHYLTHEMENTLALGLDSLFSLPDFRVNERLFALLSRLRLLATKRFAIQTRYPAEPLFDQVIKGNLLDFYRQEIKERRQFDYPPFKLLIKVSREGEKAATQEALKKLSGLLAAYEPVVFPSIWHSKSGTWKYNLLLKLEPNRWPDETLAAVLKNLPPAFTVEVDPETIF